MPWIEGGNAALKHAGYDGLIITGKAQEASYLLIENEKVVLKSAQGLRGLTTDETMARLKAEHGSSARVVCIGPAGERLIRFAIAMTDQGGGLSNGMGAVMGSKKLKAIAVKEGGEGVRVARPEKLRELTDHYRSLRRCFPTDGWEYLSRWSRDPTMEPRLMPGPEMKKEPCYGCLGRCARKVYASSDGKKGKFI